MIVLAPPHFHRRRHRHRRYCHYFHPLGFARFVLLKGEKKRFKRLTFLLFFKSSEHSQDLQNRMM